MKTPGILFLLVNYFNEEEVLSFIQNQLGKQSVENWSVIVTNNGSHDAASFKKKLSGFPQVHFTEAGSNLGYFPGAAAGLEFALTLYGSYPELIIVSNTDIEFKDENFLEKLGSLNQEFDVLGPSIQSDQTKSGQNPFASNRISKKKLQFLYRVFSFYPFYVAYQFLAILKNRLSKNIPGTNSLQSATCVYALHGSFIVFRKSFFEKGGTILFPSFLYEEELFVAEQARKLGLKSMYDPSLKLVHKEHATTRTIKSPQQISFMRDSMQYILKTFYNE